MNKLDEFLSEDRRTYVEIWEDSVNVGSNCCGCGAEFADETVRKLYSALGAYLERKDGADHG